MQRFPFRWVFLALLLATPRPAAAQLSGPVLSGPILTPIPILLDNWDFELGLQNWEKTGTAFDQQPTYGDNIITSRVRSLPLGGSYWRGTYHPVGHHGSKWIGTYERYPGPSGGYPHGSIQGDGLVGTLTSKAFVLGKNYITFLIAGGQDTTRLRVELLLKDATGANILYSDGVYGVVAGKLATGHNSELFRRAWWDVQTLKGRTVRIRIADESTGPWGHINVDDFRFQDASPLADTVNPDGTVTASVYYGSDGLYRDKTFPLWGFADLHTHPMSHLGFGKKLVHGAPDGDPAQALGNCNCTHGGWGLDNTCGNYIRAAVVNAVDEIFVYKTDNPHGDHQHDGYPYFSYWPHFTSITHQQMWHEWIRRAYDGGLRVMVALAVNNQLLAEAADGDLPKDDKASADLQIAEMKAFVSRHSDFMEIAYTPDGLRDIVRRNKLGIILGVEIDNIGNFNYATVGKSESAIRDEVRRLHGLGVRYMFPIHVVDNAFGGASVYVDLFNLGNRFSQVQPLPPNIGAYVQGTSFQVETAPDGRVTFRLKPPLEWWLGLVLKAAIEFIESIPNPIPFDNLFRPTMKEVLAGESEYQVVKYYFLTPDIGQAQWGSVPGGHRNQKGLSTWGEIALNEMMRLGVMVDIDHMSERAANRAIEIASSIGGGGYPVNSGHNGFRAMGHGNENGRTEAQLDALARLGGMMGVGYGYGKATSRGRTVDDVLGPPGPGRWTSSQVDATCGGSARAFAQNYLYAVETVGNVAFGTDTNGLVSGPGPRYGALSQLGGNYCYDQPLSQRVRYQGDTVGLPDASQALPRAKTGYKSWDINEEGVPHYGLMPDFLQDLSNVGVNAEDLTWLFRGAEAFARMWEKSVRASSQVP
ncbi:MAG TPA: membrane dipeptidase [Polyangia bacterium]|jgi:microsomal dipeptidase-like Zn-dependent dipeptidase|nr:membrane dipeptidase [Polyangia bacterium]